MEQKSDDFCQTVIRNSNADTRLYECEQTAMLKRRHPSDESHSQIVVPETLRKRLLYKAHYFLPAGHPGQNRMYYNLHRVYYWKQMVVDINAAVRNCHSCAKNRVQLRRHLNRL